VKQYYKFAFIHFVLWSSITTHQLVSVTMTLILEDTGSFVAAPAPRFVDDDANYGKVDVRECCGSIAATYG